MFSVCAPFLFMHCTGCRSDPDPWAGVLQELWRRLGPHPSVSKCQVPLHQAGGLPLDRWVQQKGCAQEVEANQLHCRAAGSWWTGSIPKGSYCCWLHLVSSRQRSCLFFVCCPTVLLSDPNLGTSEPVSCQTAFSIFNSESRYSMEGAISWIVLATSRKRGNELSEINYLEDWKRKL